MNKVNPEILRQTKSAKVESVWDYPRPPRLEPTPRRIRILGAGHTIADTTAALRIVETSHPPVYYLPLDQVDMRLLYRSQSASTFCEFKGHATYWTLAICAVGEPPVQINDVAWSYEDPSPAYAGLAHHLAFYAGRLREQQIDCWVDDEKIVPQPGDFYGGWITSNLRGPFKGAAGTRQW
jgi:uncharacterized protein (DUF427 family)